MAQLKRKRGLVVSALASGVGKTLITAALGRALARGLEPGGVGIVKLGPDYIDSGFHSAAVGGQPLNFDLWAMSNQLQSRVLAQTAPLTLFEGMLGLFDGSLFSTADVAKKFNLGVILILDVRTSAQTPVYIAEALSKNVKLAGVIFNRVASPRHLRLLQKEAELRGVKVFGALPNSEALELNSRHLGLVQAREVKGLAKKLDAAADLITAHLELEAIKAAMRPLAGQSSLMAGSHQGFAALNLKTPGKKIAVARDEAFSFTYPWVTEAWGRRAELNYFSPLANEPPPPGSDFIYLPGGYPELHPSLERADRFFDGLRRARDEGAWLYGECGGFMVLGEAIAVGNRRINTANLLGFSSLMENRPTALDYRRVQFAADTALGSIGEVRLGHEYRYADARYEPGGAHLFIDENGAKHGLIEGKVCGSFVHLVDFGQGRQGLGP